MPKINFKETIIVLGILLLSFLLYTFKLSSIPNGLYVDETLNGYNAYSILLTRKDEYGKSFPIAFRLFGSYTPPLHIYLLTLFIKILGLTTFTVRLPSVLAMTATVLIFYLCLKELLHKNPYLETFIFAFLPWTLFFARVGYEVTLGLVFFALTFLLFLSSVEKPKILPLAYLTLSVFSYTSPTARFLAPIIFMGMAISSKSKIGVLTFLLTQIPNLLLLTTPAFTTKNSLFYSADIARRGGIWLLAFIKEFLARYVTYFSPKSLFTNPDPDPQRSIPELSSFYAWMILPFLVSSYLLLTQKLTKKMKLLVFFLLTAPIPAALARDPFSTQRALPFFFPASILIFLGLAKIKDRIKPAIFYTLLGILLAFSFLQLWRSYFILLPHERAQAWGWGFEQLSQEIKSRPSEKFLIDQSRIKPAYIELAFFLKLNPKIIQDSVDPGIARKYYQDVTFNHTYKFLNIETRNIVWEEDIYKKQILVGDSLSVSPKQAEEHFLTKVFEIKNPAQETVFMGYRTNPTQKCQATNFESPYCKN